MNQFIYDFARRLDSQAWSTMLHESYYMYSWVESTHVLALMLSLGLLFLIDLRMLGVALTDMPAARLAARLNWPMLLGFAVMFITGLLLFYAVPVRSSQSVWLRLKLLLLVACAVNALVFHRHLRRCGPAWDDTATAPRQLRIGAGLSLAFWVAVVICGRLIAYDWFDCFYSPGQVMSALAGCVDGQTQF